MRTINLNLKDENGNVFAVVSVQVKTGLYMNGTGNGIEIEAH